MLRMWQTPSRTLLTTLFILTACSPAKRRFEAAERAFNEGNVGLADSLYRLFIREHPTSQWRVTADVQLAKTTRAKVLLDSVDLLVNSGDFARAQTTYHLLSEINPSFVDVGRASAFARQRDSAASARATMLALARQDLDKRLEYLGLTVGMTDAAAIAVVDRFRASLDHKNDNWEECIEIYRARTNRQAGRRCRGWLTLAVMLRLELLAGHVSLVDVTHHLGAGGHTVPAFAQRLGTTLKEPTSAPYGVSLVTSCKEAWGSNVVCRADKWRGIRKEAIIETDTGYDPAGEPVNFARVTIGLVR